jgi:transcriptional regulator with XRE-family HTH domain
MIIGDRLKAVRQLKQMSQGDIERKTGLLRCYISRVENGHTVPAIETLEKMARAMEIPLYQLFFDGDQKPKALNLPESPAAKLSTKDARFIHRLSQLAARIKDRDKDLLLGMAKKLSAAR